MTARRASALLARGWLRDGRRWNLGSALVLAGTLVAMVGTAGLLDGTRHETLDRVSDFYTGDLRITPYRAGAIPPGSFDMNASRSPVAELADAGVVVSPRIEAQFVMSRQGFVSNILETYGKDGQFPIETPGQRGDDANRTLAIGVLVGLEDGDPAAARIASHLVAGRMPKDTDDGHIEVVLSRTRLLQFLTPAERDAVGDEPPVEAICHRGGAARSTSCEVTSAQTSANPLFRDVVRMHVDIVGLYDTGVDVMDTFTIVAPAKPVRALLGHDRDERVVNVLVVQRGDVGQAQAVADKHGWATEGTEAFAADYVGQLIDFLAFVIFLVGGLLFLLPTFLLSHGITRQLALQQRELAVCTAIGVPTSVLRRALALQVLRIGLIGAGVATVAAVLMALALPLVVHRIVGLPAGFHVTTLTIVIAVAVTLFAMVIGWTLGMRARSRLPLTAQLRAA